MVQAALFNWILGSSGPNRLSSNLEALSLLIIGSFVAQLVNRNTPPPRPTRSRSKHTERSHSMLTLLYTFVVTVTLVSISLVKAVEAAQPLDTSKTPLPKGGGGGCTPVSRIRQLSSRYQFSKPSTTTGVKRPPIKKRRLYGFIGNLWLNPVLNSDDRVPHNILRVRVALKRLMVIIGDRYLREDEGQTEERRVVLLLALDGFINTGLGCADVTVA